MSAPGEFYRMPSAAQTFQQRIDQKRQEADIQRQKAIQQFKDLMPLRLSEEQRKLQYRQIYGPDANKISSAEMKQMENKANLQALGELKAQYPGGIETPEYRNATDDEKELIGLQGKRYAKNIKQTQEYEEAYSRNLDALFNQAFAKRGLKGGNTNASNGGAFGSSAQTVGGQGTTANPAQRKVGDTVFYQGKPHRITGIDPNGNYLLTPIQ